MTNVDALPRADEISRESRLMDYCSRRGRRYEVLVRTTALTVQHRHGAATVTQMEGSAVERAKARA